MSLEQLRGYLQTSVTARETWATMGTMKSMKDLGYAYYCTEDYVLVNGEHFVSAPLTPDERAIVLAAAKREHNNFPIKECFGNSMRLVLQDDRLQYAEGYAYGAVLPVLHGWALLNGKVIDLTMRLRDARGESVRKPREPWHVDRILGEFPAERVYYGKRFSRREVLLAMSDPKFSGSFIDDWERDWPLLKA
jgi:hypothetical protein